MRASDPDMPRASNPADLLSTLVGLLADALAARLDFPPRASSAASARAVPAGAAPRRAGARRRGRRRSPALTARLTDDLLDALSARLDFPPRASSAASALAAPARADARHKGKKRSPARLARVTERLRTYIESHPGERIEQIATALRQSTGDLAEPARNLLEQGKIKTKGGKRATRYYSA